MPKSAIRFAQIVSSRNMLMTWSRVTTCNAKFNPDQGTHFQNLNFETQWLLRNCYKWSFAKTRQKKSAGNYWFNKDVKTLWTPFQNSKKLSRASSECHTFSVIEQQRDTSSCVCSKLSVTRVSIWQKLQLRLPLRATVKRQLRAVEKKKALNMHISRLLRYR